MTWTRFSARTGMLAWSEAPIVNGSWVMGRTSGTAQASPKRWVSRINEFWTAQVRIESAGRAVSPPEVRPGQIQ